MVYPSHIFHKTPYKAPGLKSDLNIHLDDKISEGT